MVCYIVPWWPSWLSDQITFSNSESDVVSRLPPWPSSWILELNDSAILNLHFTPMPPIKFLPTWLTVWEEMWFQEFQDGGHLGHWNRRILAIMNFHITPMPPIMFKLKQTYPSVADVISRFSRWLPWWASWISERNHFSNSKSPYCPDAFRRFPSIRLTVREQITIEDLQDSRRRCCSKIFKNTDNFSNSESLCLFHASNQVLTQSDLWFGRRCRLKNFKMVARPSSISERKD